MRNFCALRELLPAVRIGLALGGGFARGIAHAGVLRILEEHRIPIHCITGISAGAIVAAAYASGATPEQIGRAGCAMRFNDVGRWSLGRLGLVGSECMKRFLGRLLKTHHFEEMRIPLGVVATDLSTGEPVVFSGTGPVFDPIRASCSYPGLFQPVRYRGQFLVDGAMSVEIPAALARQLGATHVISVHLPAPSPDVQPRNLFQVVNRCFQILQSRSEDHWRRESDLVLAPDVGGLDWNAFGRGPQLIEAGETAARTALPEIRQWLARAHSLIKVRVVGAPDGNPAVDTAPQRRRKVDTARHSKECDSGLGAASQKFKEVQ
jgi:NTE family protein